MLRSLSSRISDCRTEPLISKSILGSLVPSTPSFVGSVSSVSKLSKIGENVRVRAQPNFDHEECTALDFSHKLRAYPEIRPDVMIRARVISRRIVRVVRYVIPYHPPICPSKEARSITTMLSGPALTIALVPHPLKQKENCAMKHACLCANVD